MDNNECAGCSCDMNLIIEDVSPIFKIKTGDILIEYEHISTPPAYQVYLEILKRTPQFVDCVTYRMLENGENGENIIDRLKFRTKIHKKLSGSEFVRPTNYIGGYYDTLMN